MIDLTMQIKARDGARLVAPLGLSTPDAAPVTCEVVGATKDLVADPAAGQWAMALTPTDDTIRLTYRYQRGGAAYPEAMFHHRPSRYTRSAEALAVEARGIAKAAGGGNAGLAALVAHVRATFQYGHPEERFYEGTDEIPQLCSLTEGSCVDINAYFIAAARAAGYEAGYIAGCFVPEEKRTHCEDMHCWVVTRVNGQIREWDIAHHLKMGAPGVLPGLNPKPGVRVPLSHSMGWTIPALGVKDLKLLGEPMWLDASGVWHDAVPRITLAGYDALCGPAAAA